MEALYTLNSPHVVSFNIGPKPSTRRPRSKAAEGRAMHFGLVALPERV